MKKENKSDKIRRLWDEGSEVADIARLLGVRYQFAYNVVTYYVAQKQMEVQRHVAASIDGHSVLDSDQGNPEEKV